MMEDWIRSENNCLVFAKKALTWLDPFFDQTTSNFRVSYKNGDESTSIKNPTATTSIIGNIETECNRLRIIPPDLPEWETLERMVGSSVKALFGARPDQSLPTKSFGFLPLFSVSYLCQFLAKSQESFSLKPFGIAFRRILFAVYSSRSNPLHPFLMYQVTKSIIAVKELIEQFTPTSSRLKEFYSIQNDDADIKNIFPDIDSHELVKSLIEVYGLGNKDFLSTMIDHFSKGTSEAIAFLNKELKSLEIMAYHATVDQLAKYDGTANLKLDPSSLAFSLSVLSELKYSRLSSLLTRAVHAVMDCCVNGFFATAMPFHIDDKGRALFVPSVETVHTMLSTVLKNAGSLNQEDLEFLIRSTQQMDDILSAEFNQVEIRTDVGSKSIFGWCLDRAPSVSRVDAWIGMHVLAFYIKRLSLIRQAKRRKILSQYSWRPHFDVQPAWDKIVDPDLGERDSRVKGLIEKILDRNPEKIGIAPVFLLYGPPGTSKTSLVHSVASRMRWDLVTLSPSDFIADSLDQIEQRSRKIFNDLMNLDECVILLDEMDCLFRDREAIANNGAGSILDFVVPAFLPKLQSLRDYCLKRRMAVFFVANFYEKIDQAIRRPGRMDNHCLILPFTKMGQIETSKMVLHNVLKINNTTLEAEVAQMLVDRRVPCNLVYRDIEKIVRHVVTEKEVGVPVEKISIESIVNSAGITPEIYSVSRLNAVKEFCELLGRLGVLDPPGEAEYGNNDRVVEFFYKARSSEHTPEAWKAITEKWLDAKKAMK